MFERRQQVTRAPSGYTPAMARARSSFTLPSERALAFGRQYGEVLQRWADLFAAASALVEANVRMGELANEAAREFEAWLRESAESPFRWFGPEAVQRMMAAFTPPPPGGPAAKP